MKLTKDEKERSVELLHMMATKKISSYPLADGRHLVLEESTSRKVRVVKVDPADEE